MGRSGRIGKRSEEIVRFDRHWRTPHEAEAVIGYSDQAQAACFPAKSQSFYILHPPAVFTEQVPKGARKLPESRPNNSHRTNFNTPNCGSQVSSSKNTAASSTPTLPAHFPQTGSPKYSTTPAPSFCFLNYNFIQGKYPMLTSTASIAGGSVSSSVNMSTIFL